MPEKRTYTHEERRKFVQQAAVDYYARETGGPAPLDRSFMEQDIQKKSKYQHWKRISAVAAAAVLLIFACSTLSMTLLGEDVAYGDKGLLHRLYKSTMGLETDQQDEELARESVAMTEITDMDDIVDAADFLEGRLYAPTYLPEDFALEKLALKKKGDGSMSAIYTFKSKDRTLEITEQTTIDGDVSRFTAPANSETIRLKDRVLYVPAGTASGEASVTAITEDAFCTITGTGITRDEGMKIAKGMELYR